MSLKMQDSSQLYLFKSGIFFIFIDEDAKLVSSLLNLKLTNLNPVIVKCGFPVSHFEKYSKLLNEKNLSFKVIDSSNNTSFLPNEYILNSKIEKLLKEIASVNANDLSISEAYDFIEKISNECKTIFS